LEDLLAHPEKILKVIKEELEKIKERYGDDRRTRVYKQKIGEFNEEDLVQNEVTIVTITDPAGNVVAWSRSLTEEKAALLGVGYVKSPNELANISDVVTVHLASTPETKHFIDFIADTYICFCKL